MGTVALSVLRTRARERADQAGSTFVSDANMDIWINVGAQRLHEKLVDAFGDEYVEGVTAPANTVVGTSDYNLPSDFFKMYGVDLTIAGVKRTLLPFNRAERNALAGVIVPAWQTFPLYRVVGAKLRLLPVPRGVYPFIIYYAPEAVTVTGSVGLTAPNGWEEYAVLYTAIQMLLKEESDARPLQAELRALDENLARLKDDRDSAFPKSAVDMDHINYGWGW